MKHLYIFLLLTASSLGSKFSAQTARLLWANQVSGISDEQGKSVFVDGSGNVYYTGYFYGSADFDPGSGIHTLTTIFSTGGSGYRKGAFVSKLDSQGNFLWARHFYGGSSSEGISLSIDNEGN